MSVPTKGNTKGSLNPKTDATVRTGSKHENIAPNKMILPTLGFTGKAAKWWPRGVKSSFASSAFYKRTKQNKTTVKWKVVSLD